MKNKIFLLSLIIVLIAVVGCNTIIHISSRTDPQTLDTSIDGRINKKYDFEKVSGLDIPDDISAKLVHLEFHCHVALGLDSGVTDSLRQSKIYVFLSKTDSLDIPIDTTGLVTPPVNPTYNMDDHRLILTIDFSPLGVAGDSADFTIDAEVGKDDLLWTDEVIKSNQDFYVKAILVPPIVGDSVQTNVLAYLDDAWFKLEFEKDTGGLFPLLFWF